MENSGWTLGNTCFSSGSENKREKGSERSDQRHTKKPTAKKKPWKELASSSRVLSAGGEADCVHAGCYTALHAYSVSSSQFAL